MKDLIYVDTDSIKVMGWIYEPTGSLKCPNCGCEVFPVEIENGDYNHCPNCGRRNKVTKEIII